MEIRKHELPGQEEAYNYYLRHSKNLLRRYGKRFDEFTSEQKELVQIGDLLLKRPSATGYNLLLTENDMHLYSNEALIFYSNYVSRTQHFATLLSEMESRKIISRSKISFGVKASKALFKRNWKIDHNDEQLEVLGMGKGQNMLADKTVETVITFAPNTGDHALEIVDFLKEKASLRQPNHIPGSWEIPDIRATFCLKNALEMANFEEVCVNMLSDHQARLVIMRKETSFTAPWINFPAEVNMELAKFLTNFGIKP